MRSRPELRQAFLCSAQLYHKYFKIILKENGFTRKAHLLAIVNIDKIFSGANCLGRFDDTKNSQGNLKILRFCSEFILNGEKTKALITAKESIDKKGRKSNNIIKIYSLELLRE